VPSAGRRLAELLRDDALALFDESGEEPLLGDGADDFAFAEDGALALAGGKADVGVAGLAGAVDDAAHYGHGDGLGQLLEVGLYLVDQGDEVDLDAAAGGAGDDDGAALADVEGGEDIPGHG
jgi:hypothetical protein